MKILPAITAFLAAIFLTACQTTTVESASSAPTKKLTRGTSIYVVTPADGSYGGKQYTGSGVAVSSAFEAALSRYADSVIVGERQGSTAEAVAAAKEKKCAYAIIPKITRWEDRATEWSGIRDKMELFVKVVRVEDGAEMASAEVKGKSAWATFGGDHPEDLLKAPVQEFVSSLF